jgi:hypothetical protein
VSDEVERFKEQLDGGMAAFREACERSDTAEGILSEEQILAILRAALRGRGENMEDEELTEVVNHFVGMQTELVMLGMIEKGMINIDWQGDGQYNVSLTQDAREALDG